MRLFLTLLSMALFLSSCGKNSTKEVLPQSPTTLAPTQSPSPSSPTTPTSPSSPTLKWTQNEINSSTQACASGADESVATYEQWASFCRCAYTEAAKRWTLNDFMNNFDEDFEILYNNGVINQCASKAGMSLS